MTQTGLYFVGEAIADQRPDPKEPRQMHVSLGGSMYFGSLGAAKALRRSQALSAKSFYVGPVSSDYFGGLIRGDLKNAGVGMDYVRDSEFISMIAVISEDGRGGNKYSFYGRNQPNTTEHLRLEDLPETFNEERRFFCFGSVATTLSLSGQTLKQFAGMQTKQKSICLYDPNTRPSVIPDLAAYRMALEGWVSSVSIVKASDEDVAFTYPGLTHEDIARKWMSLGVHAVFITHGMKGCSVFSKDNGRLVEGRVHDGITRTVGAGDNFNAGILCGIAASGANNIDDLAAMSIDDWRKIAQIANETAYQHLLEVNELI